MVGAVSLNLSYYSGNDSYSDGPIEDELLDIVKRGDIERVLRQDNRWPILYHLSPARENLLEWYDFKSNGSILEIGAGCGALTGLLCRKAGRVVAVELSKRRAEINAYRHKQHSNLEIIVGNMNEIEFNTKFDYITLIGVLEYAGGFTPTQSPYQDFICTIKQHLEEDGKLIVAIENRLGLKYWAGAGEDHTNKTFQSLEGYLDEQRVRTFSKLELENLLKEAGFSNISFYYPFPDYKLPTSIYSDRYLPHEGQLSIISQNFDTERIVLFNEKRVFNGLVKNGLADNFSNSFLVICQQ